MNAILCHCDPCPGDGSDEEKTCLLPAGGQCFSAVEQEYVVSTRTFEPVRTFGCISSEEHALLQCKGDLVPSYYYRSIKCCNYTDLCNKSLLPPYKPRDFQREHHPLACYIVFFVIFLLSCLFIVYMVRRSIKSSRDLRNYVTSYYNVKLRKPHDTFVTLISTSGSGAGQASLIRTSISRQVERLHGLGHGRFSNVYVVRWNAVKIVEKVFYSQYECLWLREKKVYESALLRHNNVLGYVSSDILKSGLRAIYTDYHELGSLHDYLDKSCLNGTDFFKLVKSAAAGIAHLHTEVLGTTKKPAVAHCDITSKNFLINKNKECVISNFGISVVHISTSEVLETPPDFTLATVRYVAPEISNSTLIESSFDALKMADVFSLGLVFFEICQRYATVENGVYVAENHVVPFFNVLPKCPTILDMRKLYSEKKWRENFLPIPDRWKKDHGVLNPFVTSVLRECLYENPNSRPSALRLIKHIKNVEKNLNT